MAPTKALKFKVQRSEPELVGPAKQTPHEMKPLSDIDNQEGFRFHIPVIQFYNYQPSMSGKDPVAVIRRALADALVPYYPFAGRMREGPNRKLMVECTGEGVLFIEADADVRLSDFGQTIRPPFSCIKELLFDVPGSSDILHAPLLLIQVTRLKCGGFVFAIRLNHCMSDAVGLVQFMTAVAEIARGATTPSTPPVWERHILNARAPSRVTCTHHEYEEEAATKTNSKLSENIGDRLEYRSFFFGPIELRALISHLPRHLRRDSYSKIELINACVWKCRTIALMRDHPDEEVFFTMIVNARFRFDPPLIPRGYC
ncbi:Benzyl alcohol O-benzoyltransferase [Linum grandiflorum]